jgi:hypothetical protein
MRPSARSRTPASPRTAGIPRGPRARTGTHVGRRRVHTPGGGSIAPHLRGDGGRPAAPHLRLLLATQGLVAMSSPSSWISTASCLPSGHSRSRRCGRATAYDVAPDGRFLMLKQAPSSEARPSPSDGGRREELAGGAATARAGCTIGQRAGADVVRDASRARGAPSSARRRTGRRHVRLAVPGAIAGVCDAPWSRYRLTDQRCFSPILSPGRSDNAPP